MLSGTRSFRRGTLPAILVLAVAFALPPAGGFGQSLPDLQLAVFPGGFLESATTGLLRPRLSQAVIGSFLPARGPFTFPAPYDTTGVRLTNATDCGGGDCVNYVGYSYYRNINNHVGSDEMLIFLGLSRARGGPGPTLFRYDKTTDQVTKVGPLFDPSSGKSTHSGEGWYFSGTQPTKIYLDDGPRMLRYDVLSRQSQTVFDVTARYGSDKYIWQLHSSDDDRVHSATLRTSPSYEMLGCVVYHEDTAQFQYFPKLGDFDECHVDKSGRWLMILEDVDGLYGTEMRIFDLSTGAERLVWDQNGAVGHADMGHGYVIGHDNWGSNPNTILFWDFAGDPLSGRMIFHSPDWLPPAANHIAHGNARPGVPPAQQYACGSMASSTEGVWGNEIICFRLDDSLDVLVVAPVMTDMNASGGGTDAYAKVPKGNLDVTGQYFIWTSNAGGSRLDAFIVKVPARLLMDGAADTTPPAVALTAPASGATVSGTVAVSGTASDDVGVAGVQFRLDGSSLGAEDTTAPYSISWNTAAAASGSHVLTAVARDAAGNTTVSSAVTVGIAGDTTAPVISSVAASGVSSSGATITWTTGETADSHVEYGITAAYGSLSSLDAALVTAHTRSLTGLTAGTLYHYRVRSRDAAGNLATSGDFSLTTLAAPSSDGTGLLASWTLNDGAGTVAADGSGNGFGGTLVNGPAWIPGVLGSALSFDGADDYVEVQNSAALNPYPLSLAFWARTAATGMHGLVNKYLPGSRNGYQVFVNAGNLCAWYFRDASNYVWDGTGCTLMTPGFNDDRWHHIALVVDAAGGRLYVDGTLRASRGWTGTPGAASTGAALGFGRYPGTAAPYLPGALDDVRLLGRALGIEEITALVTPPDTAPPAISAVAATGLTSTGATITWTTSEAADTQVEYGPTTAYGATTTLDPAPATVHSQALGGLSAGTVYHYRVRSRDAAGNLATSGDLSFATPAPAPPSGGGRKRPVGHWKLNDGSGPAGTDGSVNGFTGALVNDPAWTTGVLGGSLSFDGLDDYVRVPHAAALNPYPMSLVFWVRTGATGLHGIVNKYLPGSRNGYQVFVSAGSLCAWYFRDASSHVWDGSGCTLMTPGFIDDQWHHVALVVDDAGGHLYVDGELRAARAWTGTPGAATTTADLGFARYPDITTPYLPGAIDDVRLYDRALGADELAGLHAGAAH